MIRPLLTDYVASAVASLVDSGTLPAGDYAPPEIAETKNPDHGDFACAFALTAAKTAGMNPRAIAQALADALGESEAISAVEIAGPGFLNLRLDPAWLGGLAATIAPGYERSINATPKKLNVEFVSVNPNGPITVGSGRGAAFGDTLCRVLEVAGHHVHREFYINDGVNSEQMRLFAESVQHYALEAAGRPSVFPAEGYKGDYVQEVAAAVLTDHADAADRDVDWFQSQAQALMIARQRKDLADFGVEFDTWFSEQTLHEADAVAAALAQLKADSSSYEKDGALWLRSTDHGDDKDRVLVRADGRPTYIASDIAYHENKFARGFDKLIDIWGPDHHGYIGRMSAAVAAAGHAPEQFEVIIFQIVRFVKEGQPAPMRKRDGNIYSLRDLMDEIGVAVDGSDGSDAEATHLSHPDRGRDVARFFYLMRSHDTHMDFDIDLATKQSDENPVFYAQYAHARICSVIAKAAEAGLTADAAQAHLLVHPKEGALIKKILDLPHEVLRCSEDYGVHRLTTYAVELARTYHAFYDVCRVIQTEEPELSSARLTLCGAARTGLHAVFGLLGISAPERM